MADIKISQLGAAIAVGDTDLMPIVSGGNTLKATGAQVKEYAIGDTNISTIGDGSVTGAISSLNTEKQPKTLATPLTIGGVSKTTVEAALDGLNSENQTLTNEVTTAESNFAYVNTNSTTASKAYSLGEQFVLGGVLRKATSAIANGATLTYGGNYENAGNIIEQLKNKIYVALKNTTITGDGTHYYADKTIDVSSSVGTPIAVGAVSTDRANIIVTTSLLQGTNLEFRIMRTNETPIGTDQTTKVWAYVIYKHN